MQFRDDDPTTEARVSALERFSREHERRHAGLVKQLVRIAGEANRAFQIAMRPNRLGGFGDYGTYGDASILNNPIKAVHVRSNYGPDIDLVDPFGPAAPNPAMQYLQPSIILDTDAGPMTIAPYGQPGPTRFSTLAASFGGVGLFILALAGYGAWTLARRR